MLRGLLGSLLFTTVDLLLCVSLADFFDLAADGCFLCGHDVSFDCVFLLD